MCIPHRNKLWEETRFPLGESEDCEEDLSPKMVDFDLYMEIEDQGKVIPKMNRHLKHLPNHEN
jgi:hypothetical protein